MLRSAGFPAPLFLSTLRPALSGTQQYQRSYRRRAAAFLKTSDVKQLRTEAPPTGAAAKPAFTRSRPKGLCSGLEQQRQCPRSRSAPPTTARQMEAAPSWD